MKYRAMFFIAVMSCAASIGRAEESQQTVDSAQKFVGLAMSGAIYRSGSFDDAMSRTRAEAVRRGVGWKVTGNPKITDVKFIKKCSDSVVVDFSEVKMVMKWDRPGEEQDLNNFSPAKFDFSYSDLLEASANGDTVIVRWRKADFASRIILGSENLATRLAYAFEFLRTQCDATSGTGF